MKTHVLSSSIKGGTSKFVPKRDGPYLIHKKVSPTTYLLAYPETPDKPIGKYHISDLKRYHAREDACSNVPEPVIPKRRRDLSPVGPRHAGSLGGINLRQPCAGPATGSVSMDSQKAPARMQVDADPSKDHSLSFSFSKLMCCKKKNICTLKNREHSKKRPDGVEVSNNSARSCLPELIGIANDFSKAKDTQ
ncbi:hypothetical protein EVAR_9580_1 [Eumeta japonica]|uniref:Uncharacterized protein n=1 Tax=Eumeta variegata TaxID=151549 RepID=A0A4C1TJE9_EUMVA|nr:hypothetical protein EVAR_9580_1 [Eumeta japonica]